MAKKSSQSVSQSTIQAAETKIEEFAEDLSRLLGNAQTKAEGWLGQRKAISEHLTGIRDTATSLLGQLGIGSEPKRGRSRARTAGAGTGRASTARAGAGGKKRRTMSPEARARIGEAQRKRWAKLKRDAK